jgi:hypothetical protein
LALEVENLAAARGLRVLFEGLAPGAAVRDLMGRAAGAERIA